MTMLKRSSRIGIGLFYVMCTVTLIEGSAVRAVESGAAKGWGETTSGQVGSGIGDGTAFQVVKFPAAVSGGITNFTMLAAGEVSALGLRADGTVWTWGRKPDGTVSNTPVAIAGLANVVAISAGQSHGLALLSDGTVRAWGTNTNGQLGDGTTTNRTTPVTVSGLSGVTAIAAGWFHSAALLSGGTVKTWGANDFGQLGDGTATDRTTPVTVTGLSGVTALACGADHVLALLSGGTVKAWGYNLDGELGDGSTTNRSTPVSVSGLTGVAAVAGGNGHSLALLGDGTVRSWGWNGHGQLGDGTTTDRNVPVSVSALSGVAKIVSGPTSDHSIAILTDRTTRTWGSNQSGESGQATFQLGDDTTGDKSTPANRAGLTGTLACSTGRTFSHAIVPPPVPEIAVSGNGQNIADGDATPSGADFTDFGTVAVGSTLDRTFTIQNSGGAALTVGTVTVSGTGFSVQTQPASTVAAGSSTTFVVRFAPGAAGAVSGSVSFSTNDSDENPFNFSLAGTGQVTPVPEIAVSGNSQNIADGDATPSATDFTDFGNVAVGATLDRTFTIQNSGSAALTVGTVTVSGTGFSVQTQPAGSVAAGSSTTFVVRFAPGVAGAVSGSVSFGTNDSDENPFNFSLAGNGQATPAPEIAVSGNGQNIADGDASPSGADFTDFGNVAVGATLDRTFTIQNIGNAALTLGAATVSGTGFSVQTQPAGSVAAGSSTTVVVRFAPGAAGAVSGSVSFGTNDSDENPFNFSLAGNGQATPAPEIAVSGNGQDIGDGDTTPAGSDLTDFGTLTVGSTLDRTFIIQNIGNAALTLGAATVSGTGFSIQAQPGASVAAGASTTLVIRFAPGAAGAVSGSVSFSTNDSSENPFDFALAGNGQASSSGNNAPVLGSVSATPNPALVGSEVSFLASATDADNDPLAFSWVFGDGNQGTGGNPKHSYSAPGTYEVVVTVTDGRGGSGTQKLTLVIQDADATKFAMLLQFVNGKTNFNVSGRDLVKVAGVIPNLPPGQLFDGQTISVDLGGVIKTFQLNAKGRGKSADGAFRMKLKFEKDPATGKKVFVGGDTTFQALVRKGSFSSQWSAMGMAAEAAPLTLPFAVDLQFDAKTYTDTLDTVYSAKGGLGKFKSKP